MTKDLLALCARWGAIALNGYLCARNIAAGHWTLASVQTLIIAALWLFTRVDMVVAAQLDKARTDAELSRRLLAAIDRAEGAGLDLEVTMMRTDKSSTH